MSRSEFEMTRTKTVADPRGGGLGGQPPPHTHTQVKENFVKKGKKKKNAF